MTLSKKFKRQCGEENRVAVGILHTLHYTAAFAVNFISAWAQGPAGQQSYIHSNRQTVTPHQVSEPHDRLLLL